MSVLATTKEPAPWSGFCCFTESQVPRVGVAGLVALSIVAVIASLSKSRLPSRTPAGDEAGHRQVQDSPTTDQLPAQPRRPHILLITIDTLRPAHLGCYGYFRETPPPWDALAREAIGADRAVLSAGSAPAALESAVRKLENLVFCDVDQMLTIDLSEPPLLDELRGAI